MFVPLHGLPPFREESSKRGEVLPVTDAISSTAIMLPTYNQLTEADQHRIVETIAQAGKSSARATGMSRRVA